ncbi:MAG: hypothetical protein ABI579_01105 [Candidatus Sumerlaeota bacterium]
MKTANYFAIVGLAVFIGRAPAAVPQEVSAILARNEASLAKLSSYSYTLDYAFTQYDENAPGTVLEDSGHQGYVMAEGKQLRCDLTTFSTNITGTYSHGQFRNIFVRNDEYMCWVERQPKDFAEEGDIAMACLYDFGDAKEWPVERKAMEGARSFDMVPFAFGLNRFSAGFRSDVELYAEGSTLKASETNEDSQIIISPKAWKSGASIVLSFSRQSGLLKSKTLSDISGNVFCQTDVTEDNFAGAFFPAEVHDKRYKMSERTGKMEMLREFTAKASDVTVGKPIDEDTFRLPSLHLPDDSSIGWYVPGDRIMRSGLKVRDGIARPVADDDVAFLDSNGVASGVDRSIIYF